MKELLRRQTPALLLVGSLLLLIAQGALPHGHLRHGLNFVLLWLIPAYLWAHALSHNAPPLEAALGGAGMALLTPTIITLIATYIPGPLPLNGLILVAATALILPFLLSLRTGSQPPATDPERTVPNWTKRQCVAFVAILLLAAWLRLENFSYKEFQGDEGVIMERAAQALLGDEMALLRHQKGPVEILLPLIPWGMGGAIDESWTRAAFAWAGWLVVPAIAALGRRWFDGRTALLAALLFTLGGFAIAFSRIVQYQSLVMLWGALSLLFAARYQRHGRAADLLLAAAFLAGGLLAHYDAVLAAPAVAWLVLDRWRREPQKLKSHLLPALLTGGALLAVFYIPYLSNPTIGGTGSYLLQDRLGGTLLSWSGPDVWRMATFYNSIYYIALLLLLAVAGLLFLLRVPRRPAVLLYLLTPLLFYTLVVVDPRTHIYTIFPGLSIVAAHGFISWRAQSRSAWLRSGSSLLVALLLVASLIYVVLLFVDVTPERQRTWAQNRPALYPTTWSEPPLFGLFGFPHQAGWRVAPAYVSELPYSSNEEPEITGWYLAQAPRTQCPDFQTFLVAANAQDALPYDASLLGDDQLQTVITVNGAPSLHIYGPEATSPAVVEATGHTLWRTPEEVAPPFRSGEEAVNLDLGDAVRLLGYTIASTSVRPGEAIDVVLYWQALAPIERNLQVFVHLYDGELWAQHDGAPNCDMQPTSGWEPGQIIRDAHRLQLPAETPSGAIPMLVGMYDLLTHERLLVSTTGDDHIHLTGITIAPE